MNLGPQFRLTLGLRNGGTASGNQDPPNSGGPSTGITGAGASSSGGGHLNTANDLEDLLARVLEGFFNKKVHRKRSIKRAFEKLHQKIDSCASIDELNVIAHLNKRIMKSIPTDSRHYNMAWELFLAIDRELKRARERFWEELHR